METSVIKTDNALQMNKIHFAVMAVEATAQQMGVPTMTLYKRLKQVNLIDKLILGCYDVLHTQSIKHVTEDIMNALFNWERKMNVS